jgi:hypothetical protein
MARQRKLIDPVRNRLIELIDQEVAMARDHLQTAQDIAEVLNAADKSGDRIEIDGNVVLGLFNKEDGEVGSG